MYQYINTKVLFHGVAVLYRFDGKYHVDVFLSDGKAPVHHESFSHVSDAKQWRENSAQVYANH